MANSTKSTQAPTILKVVVRDEREAERFKAAAELSGARSLSSWLRGIGLREVQVVENRTRLNEQRERILGGVK